MKVVYLTTKSASDKTVHNLQPESSGAISLLLHVFR